MKNRILSLSILVILAFFIGCAGLKPNPENPIRTVAVLPMVNNTNDVNGPKLVRELFDKELHEAFYTVKSMKTVDEVLRDEMGITLGKQLEMTTPQKLGEKLGVDGVFYGYLLNFEDTITGVYNVKKVRMGWKLVNTKTGEIAWGRGIAVKRQSGGGAFGSAVSLGSALKDLTSKDEVSILPASKNPMKEMPGLGNWILLESRNNRSLTGSLLGSIGEKIITKMTKSHLKAESKTAIEKLFNSPAILTGPVE